MAAARACDFSSRSLLLSRTSSWVRGNSPSVLEEKTSMLRDCCPFFAGEVVNRVLNIQDLRGFRCVSMVHSNILLVLNEEQRRGRGIFQGELDG